MDAGDFVLFCGYQEANEGLVEQAVQDGFKLVYMTVTSTASAEPAANVIYLNPYWPMSDGCVEVPGYDVAILPASGAVNAAIYWALLAERGL